jgi:hypothetical protein
MMKQHSLKVFKNRMLRKSWIQEAGSNRRLKEIT